MNLKDLFEKLSYGELSNLAMAGEANGDITEYVRPRIVHYANEALMKLYSRFVLKENDVLIQLYSHITFYHLLPRFSVNYTPEGAGDNEPHRYILDLPMEKFQGDVIKILAVRDGCGDKLPLNDDNQVSSVFTPQAHVLQVPLTDGNTRLSVLYQAKHPKLTGDLFQPIELPEILWTAFTSFIAYKVFSHMNTQENSVKAQEHLANFERACQEIVEKDLANTSISNSNVKFHIRGWI